MFGLTRPLSNVISGSPASADLAGDELFSLVQSGAAKRGTPEQIRRYVGVGPVVRGGNGTADDGAKIAAAISAAVPGDTIKYPAGGIFRVTDIVQHPTGVGLDMTGAQILYDGPFNRTVLKIGQSGVPNQSGTGRQLQFLGLDVRYKINPSAAELADPNFVAIQFWNLRQCIRAEIAFAMGFTRAVEIIGDHSSGNCYNQFVWGRLINNRKPIVLRTAGVSGGFVTQNRHAGGAMITTDVYPDLDVTGITTTWDHVSSDRNSDAQIFDGMCFELGEHGGAGDRIPVYHDGTGHNYQYNNVRMENCDGPFAIFDGNASLPSDDTYVNNNLVSFTTYSGAKQAANPIVEINRAVGNRVTGMQTVDSVFGGDLRPRNVAGCVKAGGAAGEKCLTGEWLHITSGGVVSKNFVSTLVSLKPDYVELAEIGSSIGVGVPVDLSTRKTVRVRMNSVAGFGGRLMVTCYDRRGRQITSAVAGADILLGYWNYHNGQAATSLPYSSTFGGSFRNVNKDQGATVQTFRFADNVHHVIFAASNNASGDGVVRLINLDITVPPIGSRDGNDGTGFYLPGVDLNGRPVSSAMPNAGGNTHGAHYAGEIIENKSWVPVTNPASGWQCKQAGRVAPAWVGGTAYVADAMTVNGTNVYICATPGTSAASGGPTTTGSGIADGVNGLTWDYVVPLATFTTLTNAT